LSDFAVISALSFSQKEGTAAFNVQASALVCPTNFADCENSPILSYLQTHAQQGFGGVSAIRTSGLGLWSRKCFIPGIAKEVQA
jgi:hypothetical protein